MANPERCKVLIKELKAARDEAREAIGMLNDLEQRRVALEAERDGIHGAAKAQQDSLDARESEIAARSAALDRREEGLDRREAAHAAGVERHNAEVAAHASRLAEVDRLKQAIAA